MDLHKSVSRMISVWIRVEEEEEEEAYEANKTA